VKGSKGKVNSKRDQMARCNADGAQLSMIAEPLDLIAFVPDGQRAVDLK
jgi:hypothetical protein